MLCKTCGESKNSSHFYTTNKSHCKSCVRARVTKRRNDKIDEIRAYDRERGNRQTSEITRQYRHKYPNKYKAHNMVNNYLRDGKISKPDVCSECPSDFGIHGHHDDYSKPLEIRWLCAACHHQWHAKHGEALNANEQT